MNYEKIKQALIDSVADYPDQVLGAIKARAAEITDDWAERQMMDPSKAECDGKFVRELVRLLLIQVGG